MENAGRYLKGMQRKKLSYISSIKNNILYVHLGKINIIYLLKYEIENINDNVFLLLVLFSTIEAENQGNTDWGTGCLTRVPGLIPREWLQLSTIKLIESNNKFGNQTQNNIQG